MEAEEEATGRDRGQTEDREEHENLRALLMTCNRSHARFRAHAHKHAFSHIHFSLPLTRTRSPLLSLACTYMIFAFFLCLSSGPTAFLLACINHFLACLCFFVITQVPLSSVMRQLKKMGWGQTRLQCVRTAMGKKQRPGERDSGGQVGEYGFYKVVLHTYIFESQARKERGGFFFPDEERRVPA